MDPREHELPLVGYLVREPGLLRAHAERLREFHFEYPNSGTIFRIIAGAVRKFGQAPALHEAEFLLRSVSASSEWSLTRLDQALDDLKLVYESPVTAASGEILHAFVQEREIQAIAKDLATLPREEVLKRRREIRDRLDALEQDQRDFDDVGISLFSPEGIELGTQLVDDQYKLTPIPTGFPSLDEMLLGGLRPEESTVVMAATGKGKTLALINMAAHMIRCGKRIIYYALDNRAAEMAERMFACMCRIPISKDKDLAEYRREILTGLGGLTNDLFWVRTWPPHRKRVTDMKVHCDRLREIVRKRDLAAGVPEAQAGHIDCLVADYGDQFQPDRKREAFRMELGDIFTETVTVSVELKLPVLTATQGNRQALSNESIGLEHVSEALAKLQPVANVLGLCQSRVEKAHNEMRLNILKARRPEAEGWAVHLKVDKRRQLLWENPDKPPVPIENWEELEDVQTRVEAAEEGRTRNARRQQAGALDEDLSNLPRFNIQG